MATQKALWLPKIGAEFILGQNEIPEPGPGEALVKLEASALNPLDVEIQDSGFFEIEEYPAILGEEGAGVVEKVGEEVTHLARGDRVLFQTTLKNKFASFQEYCLVVAELVAKIPPNLSFDQAASILVAFNPFAVATYAQEPLGIALTPPFEEDGLGKYAGCPIVIFGGASSLGQQAIQLAKLSGFSPIITTASLHNQELLLSLGATHVIDRKLSNVVLVERVRQLTTTPLTYIFDAVSVEDTQQAAYTLLAPGGTLVVVLSPQVGGGDDGSGKKVLLVLGSFHPLPNRALGAKFAMALTEWLEKGDIKPNHIEVLPGGLNGVVPGLKRLASGVSATKLIIRPPETTNGWGRASEVFQLRRPSPHQAAPSIPHSCPPTVGPSLSVQTHVEFAQVTTETGRSGDNVMKTGLNCSLSFDSKLSESARSLGYGGCPISSESRSVGAYQFWAATLCDE